MGDVVSAEGLRPPPEADLIRVARLARGISPEAAAEQAPIRLGGARWRHIERGYDSKHNPVVGPDKTVAHMAHVVGLAPERLAEVGRDGAADVLREILRQAEAEVADKQQPYADMSDRLERTAWEMPLSVDDRKLIVDMLRQAKIQGQQDRSA